MSRAQLIIRTPVGKLQIISPLLGKHNVYNILAAVATGIVLKVRERNQQPKHHHLGSSRHRRRQAHRA